jgi:hypothetical protein
MRHLRKSVAADLILEKYPHLPKFFDILEKEETSTPIRHVTIQNVQPLVRGT